MKKTATTIILALIVMRLFIFDIFRNNNFSNSFTACEEKENNEINNWLRDKKLISISCTGSNRTYMVTVVADTDIESK